MGRGQCGATAAAAAATTPAAATAAAATTRIARDLQQQQKACCLVSLCCRLCGMLGLRGRSQLLIAGVGGPQLGYGGPHQQQRGPQSSSKKQQMLTVKQIMLLVLYRVRMALLYYTGLSLLRLLLYGASDQQGGPPNPEYPNSNRPGAPHS